MARWDCELRDLRTALKRGATRNERFDSFPLPTDSRASYNGITSDFQSDDVSSILSARSILEI